MPRKVMTVGASILCVTTGAPDSTNVSSPIFEDFTHSPDPGGPKKKKSSK